MNKTTRNILGILCVIIITFSTINIFQNMRTLTRVDITDQKIYTLSEGTYKVLNKLNQPITLKLYYTKTAVNDLPDEYRFFNDYYYYVKALLEEYQANSNNMVKLEFIDPRPLTQEEEEARGFGLASSPLRNNESFFFGLVLQTEFGVTKKIAAFSPRRKNFVEYDVSYLIDTAITKQKRRIGVISSLNVFGDNMSGYMAQMMRQRGQRIAPPWIFIQQLKQQFEVNNIPTTANEITDTDILIVYHPKELPDNIQFAIDQFVLKGGPTIVCVDPFAVADQPQGNNPQARMNHLPFSDLNRLLGTWGVEIPIGQFCGDLSLTQPIPTRAGNISVPGVTMFTNKQCNPEDPISAPLNQILFYFAGGIIDKKVEGVNISPILSTTDKGNVFEASHMEFLAGFNNTVAQNMQNKFTEGVEPVNVGIHLTGKFKSAYPNGVMVNPKPDPDAPADSKPEKIKLTGLTESENQSSIVVFSDIDFLSDNAAYEQSFLGTVATRGDNSALLLNTIEVISGSADLLAIRSRGNFQRRFEVIDEIENKAEKESLGKLQELQAKRDSLDRELQQIIVESQKSDGTIVVGESFQQKIQQKENEKRQAEKEIKQVQLGKRVQIEAVQNYWANMNMFGAPVVILIIAIILALKQKIQRKKHLAQLKDSE